MSSVHSFRPQAGSPPQLSKHVVLYGVGERDVRCGKCRYFIAPAACVIVEGQIISQGKCERIDLSRLSNSPAGGVVAMETVITMVLKKRRSLERALDDLRAKFYSEPDADLARMVAQLEAEIAERAVMQLRRT